MLKLLKHGSQMKIMDVKKPLKISEIKLKFEEEPIDLEAIVKEVIDDNPKALLDYRAGVRSSLDFLISEVMKKSGGRADPKKIRNIIISKL
jgi:aspartyl-tRNA(Asn)/glutamyl-tRNA(Gln) amidotransferase subunit B